jgi:hypothetical protein
MLFFYNSLYKCFPPKIKIWKIMLLFLLDTSMAMFHPLNSLVSLEIADYFNSNLVVFKFSQIYIKKF